MSPVTLTIRVELFGSARIACGKKCIEIEMAERACVRDVTHELAKKCPELLGKAILDDGSGLMESYTLNLNGTEFITSEEFRLKQGDSLLLFSSQAGG
jgi:molybdopterin converting factor small subunit